MTNRFLLVIGILLAGLLLGLQYRLWWGDGSLAKVGQLQRAIDQQQAANAQLADRNAVLAAEVRDLKQGLAAIEARARSELGMIKEDEIFYRVIETPPQTPSP